MGASTGSIGYGEEEEEDIMELAEKRSIGSGNIAIENHTMINSGGTDHYSIVVVILTNEIANATKG